MNDDYKLVPGDEAYKAGYEAGRLDYAHPIPPPDVRELVEAGCNLHMFVDLFAGTDESMRTAASCWRDALAKWGNKV